MRLRRIEKILNILTRTEEEEYGVEGF